MKNKIDLHSVFQEMDPEDFNLGEGKNQAAQVSRDNIRKLTMDKIRGEKQENIIPFRKYIVRYAMVACAVIAISGITVTVLAATNTKVKQIVSKIFGISQTEIIALGESIENKDYRLTVHEIICDSQRGVAVVSVDALSDSAVESFRTDNVASKFGDIGFANGMRELEGHSEEATKYFRFDFKINNQEELKQGVTFTMEGMKQKINIPIAQTIDLKEVDLDIKATEEYPVSYNKMQYSEIGFTLSGIVEIEDPNQKILIEFIDGSINEICNEHPDPQLSDETSVSITKENGEQQVSVKATEFTGQYKLTITMDDEWISGYSYRNYDGVVIYNFSFEKKMDWSTVKSIIINDTVIQMQL